MMRTAKNTTLTVTVTTAATMQSATGTAWTVRKEWQIWQKALWQQYC